jgi:hypothetical protein
MTTAILFKQHVASRWIEFREITEKIVDLTNKTIATIHDVVIVG